MGGAGCRAPEIGQPSTFLAVPPPSSGQELRAHAACEESRGAPSLLPALHPRARGEGAGTAAGSWHGAMRGDEAPRSDPLGTAPRAEGLRCPSARCQVRGEGGRGGTHSDAPPTPTPAPCQAWGADAPFGTAPGAEGFSPWRPASGNGDPAAGVRAAGSLAWGRGLAFSPLQHHLHAAKARAVASSRSRGAGEASGSWARCAPLGGRLAGD